MLGLRTPSGRTPRARAARITAVATGWLSPLSAPETNASTCSAPSALNDSMFATSGSPKSNVPRAENAVAVTEPARSKPLAVRNTMPRRSDSSTPRATCRPPISATPGCAMAPSTPTAKSKNCRLSVLPAYAAKAAKPAMNGATRSAISRPRRAIGAYTSTWVVRQAHERAIVAGPTDHCAKSPALHLCAGYDCVTFAASSGSSCAEPRQNLGASRGDRGIHRHRFAALDHDLFTGSQIARACVDQLVRDDPLTGLVEFAFDLTALSVDWTACAAHRRSARRAARDHHRSDGNRAASVRLRKQPSTERERAARERCGKQRRGVQFRRLPGAHR